MRATTEEGKKENILLMAEIKSKSTVWIPIDVHDKLKLVSAMQRSKIYKVAAQAISDYCDEALRANEREDVPTGTLDRVA